MDDDEFVLLLLADSNLPTGAFVASAGLESSTTHGFVPGPDSLLAFVRASLHSYAHSALPVVADAHRTVAPLSTSAAVHVEPFAALLALDALYESITLNHVARRASTSQGVALLTLYSKAFAPPPSSQGTPPVAALVDRLKLAVRRGDTHGHLPLCWGVLTGALQLPLERAQHLALFLHARALLSAAVRLNTIGPYLAHRMLLHDVRPLIDAFASRCSTLSTAIFTSPDHKDTDQNGPANTWPLGDILAMRHDLQHSRIFNS